MPTLRPRDVSDLFRWLVREDRIGAGSLSQLLLSEEVDEICSLIEGTTPRWQDEWRQFQEATQPPFGIGTQPRLQG